MEPRNPKLVIQWKDGGAYFCSQCQVVVAWKPGGAYDHRKRYHPEMRTVIMGEPTAKFARLEHYRTSAEAQREQRAKKRALRLQVRHLLCSVFLLLYDVPLQYHQRW